MKSLDRSSVKIFPYLNNENQGMSYNYPNALMIPF